MTDGPAGPASEFADAWEQTGSLLALREAIDAGTRVRPVIARRGGLARLLDVSTAAATGLADRLVAHGHVERRPHVADRRRTSLQVTPAGREEVLGHLLPMFRALDR